MMRERPLWNARDTHALTHALTRALTQPALVNQQA